MKQGSQKNVDLFRYFGQFVDLTDADKVVLSKYVRTRSYQKGQFVLLQGEHCMYMNFVIKGCLKTYFINDQKDEQTFMFAIENWWSYDIASFVNNQPAEYNIQCIEDSEVIQISLVNLNLLYQQIPELEHVFRVLFQNSVIALEKRIVRNFKLSAKERYLNFRKMYPNLEQRIPQYSIASYLGITKQFLSKIRKELSKK